MDVSNDLTSITEIRDEESNDCISILIATDNHLGYLENDPIRGQDSLNTFKEILQIAEQNDVDMVLLGGDLFHENRPSRKTLYETMKILRTHSLGDKKCQLEIINDNDDTRSKSDNFNKMNFRDPNYKVAMPVFSIHGNHDDPSGDGYLCALDVLSVSGLVNYFGKVNAVENIVVKPILLRKGRTTLALYGLGNVRDQRLHRLFTDNAVKINPPPIHITNESFNLMVLHQNRVAHSIKNYIPEHYLPDFMNMIIWGHEHDCKIEPMYNEQQNFYVSQPGSSVATSLVEGELEPKHVAKLNIIGDQFELKKIRLRTVRPFVMGEIVLKEADGLDPTKTSSVNAYLAQKVDELIKDAKNQWLEMNDYDYDLDEESFPLPLIKLKVEYSGGFTVLNNRQFGQKFVNLVANNHEILFFYRRRVTERKKNTTQSTDLADEFEMPENLSHNYVTDLVTENMKSLSILPENALNEATTIFVDKDDPHAIEGFYNNTIKKTRTKLRQENLICDDKILVEQAHKQKNFLSKQYAEMNPDQRLIEMSNNEAPPDNSNEVKKRKSTRLKNVEEPPAKRTYTRKKPISSTTQKRINFPTLASSSSQQVRSQSQNMDVDDNDFFE